MSISTLESLQSVRMLHAQGAYTRRVEQAEADLAYEFIKAIEAGDPDCTPQWAGTTPDYEAARKHSIPFGSKAMPRRRVTVAEAFDESMDFTGGPTSGDLVKLLACAVRSTDPMLALAARQLIERCAAVYASHNAEIDE